ncbi:MAG: WD40 repeat domain-containing protein [Planctomycetota bacterium]
MPAGAGDELRALEWCCCGWLIATVTVPRSRNPIKRVRRESRRSSVSANPTRPIGCSAGSNHSGAPRRTLRGYSHKIMCVTFSPDGTLLAPAGWDRTVRLCNPATGKEVATLTGHGNWVYSVAFSPDGKTLSSGSIDHMIRLWNVQTGEERVTLRGHTAGVLSVAFSHDGQTLASSSDDATTRLWRAATKAEVQDAAW